MERAHLSTNPLCARSIIRNALCLCIADDPHQAALNRRVCEGNRSADRSASALAEVVTAATGQRILRRSKLNVTRERYIKVRDEQVEIAIAAFEQAIAKSHAVP